MPRPPVVEKVEACGISDALLQWIDSFLTNRYQRVVLRNAVSPWLPFNSEAFPRVVFSSFSYSLFSSMISTLVARVVLLDPTKFADDIKIYANANLNSTSLQIAIDNIVSWASTWFYILYSPR